MDEKDKIDVTETDILYDHLTSTTSLVEAISLLERKTDKPEASATQEKITEGATGRHRHLPKNEY